MKSKLGAALVAAGCALAISVEVATPIPAVGLLGMALVLGSVATAAVNRLSFRRSFLWDSGRESSAERIC